MPKTEVILTNNVVGLGAESDQVKVAAGFARNFLFPQGLAIPLTNANKKQIEALQKRRTDREAKELHTMTELGNALSKLTLVIAVKTGEDGKLFGSVTSGTIADELKHQYEAQVDKRKIHLDHPIKSLGEHTVDLNLHSGVHCKLKVRVESSTPLSPEVQAALAEEAAKAAGAKLAEGDGKGAAKGGKGEKREAKGGDKPRAEKGADKGDKPRGERKPKAKAEAAE